MNVYVDRNKNVIEWNVGERIITIHNEHVLYAFKHGSNMLMIKEKYESSESGFSTYDKGGNLVFSYKYLGNCITFRKVDIASINGSIISADYDETKEKFVVLVEKKEIRSLLVYDEKGNYLAEIMSPRGYTFVSLKNSAGNIMVVAQGTNNMTRDSFGRNDWNFIIDYENHFVEKKSIIQ